MVGAYMNIFEPNGSASLAYPFHNSECIGQFDMDVMRYKILN